MSTMKTPDNATMPEPTESSGHKLARQQAKGRKMVAPVQSRGARRAELRALWRFQSTDM